MSHSLLHLMTYSLFIRVNQALSKGVYMKNERNAFELYMAEVEKIPLMTAAQEKEVAEKARGGDKASKEKLIRANLRFVVKTAWKFRDRGVDLEDLICEGNEGLMIAAEKFDPSKNIKFISYAVWWINLSINKAIYAQGRDVKIPVGKSEELASSKWKMGSLDKPLDYESDTTFGDSLVDDRYLSPEESLMKSEFTRNFYKELENLNELERKVVDLRFALTQDEPMSLMEVGKLTGYSKERIRQIEGKALRTIGLNLSDWSYAA